eukprot:Colp12_sorted_trinity150504_noHs@11925
MGLEKLGPLPQGWEAFQTDEGRTVYINHLTEETTWIDPRDSADRERDPDELPYGWEKGFDPVIGVYFIDHINCTNTLGDPRLAKEVQAQRLAFKASISSEKLAHQERQKTLTLKKSTLDVSRQMIEQSRNDLASLRFKLDETEDQAEREALEKEFAELNHFITEKEAKIQQDEEEHAMLEVKVNEAETILAQLEVLESTIEEPNDNELEAAREATLALDAAREEYEREELERRQLEEELRQLTTAIGIGEEEFEDEDFAPPPQAEEIIVKKSVAEDQPRTRLDLGLELISVRKAVDDQRREIEELKAVKTMFTTQKNPKRTMLTMRTTKGGERYKTLRRVMKNEDFRPTKPEELSFSDKLSFFKQQMSQTGQPAAAAKPKVDPVSHKKTIRPGAPLKLH